MTEQAQGQPASDNASAPAETNVNIDVSGEPAVPSERVESLSKRDLDKAAGEARKKGEQKGEERGRESALSELLQSLGMESTDDLQSVVQERRQAQEAQATEAEKLHKNFEKADKERTSLKEELENAYTHIAQITQERALSNAFIEAGVTPEKMKVALKLADTDSLDIDDNGEVTGIEDAVQAVREELPDIFGGAARSIGAASSPGTEQISTPGWDKMPAEDFEAAKRRLLFGEHIPLR